MRGLVLGAALIAVLAGCSKSDAPKRAAASSSPPAAAATPVASGFSHQPRFDAFGYYSPDREIKAGDLRFSVVAVGDEAEFKIWEVGDRRASYAPVMLVFEDAVAPAQSGELGPTPATVRVMPDAYAVSETEVRFEGHDPRLGRVSFSGALDRQALAVAQADASGSPAVLKGVLQIGAQRFENVSFTWFGGD